MLKEPRVIGMPESDDSMSEGEADQGAPAPGMPRERANPTRLKESEAMFLPTLNRRYLKKYTFKDWKALWDARVTQGALEGVKPYAQVRILLELVDMPWNEELRHMAYSLTVDKVLTEIEKRCQKYEPVSKVHMIVQKSEKEDFEEYVLRLKKAAEDAGLTYTDKGLADLLYSIAPPQYRAAIEQDWKDAKPAELACAIDREILLHRGFTVSAEPQPLMLHMSGTEEEDEEAAADVNAISGRKTKKIIRCYYCNRTGHTWKQCRDKQMGRPPKNKNWRPPQGRSKKGSINNLGSDTLEELQFLEICVNNKEVKALIDTGSQVTALAWESYTRLQTKPKLDKSKLNLYTANHNKLEIMGEAKFCFRINGLETEMWISCIVIRNLAAEVILGMDTQKAMGLILDPARGLIICKNRKIKAVGSDKKLEQVTAMGNFGKNLSPSQREEMEAIIEENNDVFVEELRIGKPIPGVEHIIELATDQPIAVPVRQYSPKESKLIQQAVDELKKLKILQPSKSPYCARALVVPKHDGSPRLVIDYQRLNKVTKKDKFPLPIIKDIIRRIGEAKFFTTMDLASGFFQFKLREEDMEKTAFSIEGEHLEYTRMPMGLTNSPATMQRAMTRIFGELLHKGVEVFVDDILIYSEDWESHLKLFKEVVKRLKLNNIQVKQKKCCFGEKEVHYLGFIIGNGQKRADPQKVKGILEMTAPSNVKDLRSFLGMIGFYREFIKGMGATAEPLNRLLKKDTKFEWGEEQEAAFSKLKEEMAKHVALEIPHQDRPYEIHTDASTKGIGAVLIQRDEKGIGHIIECASKALGPAQSKQSIPALECYAIMWALKKFRPYVQGNKFLVVTDHYGLKFLQSKERPSATLQRWWWELYDFDFEVVYRKGENNIADPLSRLIPKEQLELENSRDWEELENSGVIMEVNTRNFIAEKILGKKTEGKRTYYLTKWKGFGTKEATWETKYSIRNAKLVREYERSLQDQAESLKKSPG